MKAAEFCYWLQGYFENSNPSWINEEVTQKIKNHLNMVFIHDIDKSYPVDQQEALNEAHNNQKITNGQPQKIMRC